MATTVPMVPMLRHIIVHHPTVPLQTTTALSAMLIPTQDKPALTIIATTHQAHTIMVQGRIQTLQILITPINGLRFPG